MWTIHSPTTEAFLLGTVPLGARDPYPLAPEMESAFRRSKFLVVQARVRPTDEAAAKELVAEHGMYPPDDALSNHLPSSTTQALNRKIQELRLGSATIERLKPWVLCPSLLAVRMRDFGYPGKYSLMRHFEDAAATAGIKVVELESTESQAVRQAQLPDEVQIRWLEETIADLDGLRENLDLSAECWFRGDVAGMERERIQKPLEKHPGHRTLAARMLDGPNAEYARQLTGWLKGSESFFLVVSVDHLLGENGLLHTLEKMGIAPRQVVVE